MSTWFRFNENADMELSHGDQRYGTVRHYRTLEITNALVQSMSHLRHYALYTTVHVTSLPGSLYVYVCMQLLTYPY